MDKISPITYENIKKAVAAALADNRSLPLSATNEYGNNVIVSSGGGDGGHFYRLDTLQDNGWIRVNEYYEDGTITEIYER